MSIAHVLDASSGFFGHLVDPAIRSLALACIAGGALALCRAKNVEVRLGAWRAVLLVALAMPFLALLMPPFPVSVPMAERLGRLQAAAINQTAVARDTDTPVAKKHETLAISPAVANPVFNYTAAPSRHYSRPTPAAVLEAAIVSRRTPLSRMAVAAIIYASVAIFFLVRLLLGISFGRRLERNSHPIHDPQALERLYFFANSAGLRGAPGLAESDLLSVPVTLGIKDPSILLPATWRDWEPAELDAVLAHEVSHVARRDALTERLSLLHRAVFWFSPLSWWLDRRLAELAEEASDDAALAAGADRTRYAETVLGFFAALEAAPGRVWWQGVAMASAGQAEKRLDRILEWKGSVAMQLTKPVVVAVALLAIPVVCVTAAFRPTIENTRPPQSQSAQPPAPAASPRPAPAPAAAPEPAAPLSQAAAPAPAPVANPATTVHVSVVPMMRVDPHVVITPLTPIVTIDDVSTMQFAVKPDVHVATNVVVTPLASIAPHVSVMPMISLPRVAPFVSQAAQQGQSGHSNTLITGEDDDGQQFVISSGNSSVVVTGNGFSMNSDGESNFVNSLRHNVSGDFIWFLRDGKAYVITDSATVKRAMEFFAPAQELGRKQEELGKQQEALGAKQEALGKQQEALGDQMEKVRVKIPDMPAELQKLEAELKKLGDSGTQEDLSRVQQEIGEIQSRIGELQSQAGEQQSQLGEKQGALGEQQGKLGDEQGRLGDQQGELGRQQEEANKKASQQMKQLLDQAVAQGLVKPE
ncbi:MAG: M56 family metallopeptidase [Candidatus Acidiferrales bacterium]